MIRHSARNSREETFLASQLRDFRLIDEQSGAFKKLFEMHVDSSHDRGDTRIAINSGVR